MAVFSYIAWRHGTRCEEGTILADTARQARDLLRERGLTVQRVAERSARSQATTMGRWLPASWAPLIQAFGDQFAGFRGRRNRHQVNSFIRELGTLTGVGLPLLEALDTLTKQLRSRQDHSFRRVIMTLKDDVSAGLSLSEAMARQPRVFDSLAVQLVRVGQEAGQLDSALDQLAEFRGRSQQLRGRLGSALLYPAVVLAVGVLVTLFLMSYVVPALLESLLEAGKPLPWATRWVKATSDLLLHHGWLLGLGVVAVTFTAMVVGSTSGGRRSWHRLLLKLPGVGEVIRRQAVVRVGLVISTLMRGGVPFLQALAVARDTVSNVLVREALDDVSQAVHGGREIGEALEKTGVFPPTVVQVFHVGQQSGRLEEMLERLAQDYDQQVQAAAQRLASLLEPVLILLLALVVGFIAFATILPILEAGNVL